MWIHPTGDDEEPDATKRALDRALKLNKCEGGGAAGAWQTAPTEPYTLGGARNCRKYMCPAAFPVVFCTPPGMPRPHLLAPRRGLGPLRRAPLTRAPRIQVSSTDTTAAVLLHPGRTGRRFVSTRARFPPELLGGVTGRPAVEQAHRPPDLRPRRQRQVIQWFSGLARIPGMRLRLSPIAASALVFLAAACSPDPGAPVDPGPGAAAPPTQPGRPAPTPPAPSPGNPPEPGPSGPSPGVAPPAPDPGAPPPSTPLPPGPPPSGAPTDPPPAAPPSNLAATPPDEPLPPCKRTVDVGGGGLGGAIAAAAPG